MKNKRPKDEYVNHVPSFEIDSRIRYTKMIPKKVDDVCWKAICQELGKERKRKKEREESYMFEKGKIAFEAFSNMVREGKIKKQDLKKVKWSREQQDWVLCQ
jgi:hypothetical protein